MYPDGLWFWSPQFDIHCTERFLVLGVNPLEQFNNSKKQLATTQTAYNMK